MLSSFGMRRGFLQKSRYNLIGVAAGVVWFACSLVLADDWPQWLGPQRDGVWRETGILEKMPDGGPKVLWRVAINKGYCGPTVAGGRIYLLDRQAGKMPERKKGDRTLPQVPGNERVLCLDAATGQQIWEKAYDCAYRIDYAAGPRATPVVAGHRLFTLGAMGDLQCLNTADGKKIWSVSFITNFNAEPPTWGWAAHPLLDGQRLICTVGGSNSAVVAFDKDTGKEIWRALSAQEIGYAPPMIYTIDGKRQVIIWHPDGLAGLEPETGKTLWTQPYPIDSKPQRPEVTIATPRSDGRRLFLTEYYKGAAMFEIAGNPPSVKVLWNRHGKPGNDFGEGLHSIMCTPVFKGDSIYGVCANGELRCLDAATGDRKWETFAATGGKSAWLAHAFIVEQGPHYWLWNDQGELILANLGSKGYEELGRAKLLEPQENARGRDVIWCHPAFANRCAYLHNGKELICVSLAAS
jgi:outer membrane protein assembly factor BamB